VLSKKKLIAQFCLLLQHLKVCVFADLVGHKRLPSHQKARPLFKDGNKFWNSSFKFFCEVNSLKISNNFIILKFLSNVRASRERCKKTPYWIWAPYWIFEKKILFFINFFCRFIRHFVDFRSKSNFGGHLELSGYLWCFLPRMTKAIKISLRDTGQFFLGFLTADYLKRHSDRRFKNRAIQKNQMHCFVFKKNCLLCNLLLICWWYLENKQFLVTNGCFHDKL
jgi:hypothetical protein